MWDLAIVGAGPAGTSAALGALSADPHARVLLLDRAAFPRDKSCGDGIAPHVLHVLADVGVTGLVDDWTPARRLVLQTSTAQVGHEPAQPLYVVPRTVFDFRLVQAAVARGAVLRQQRVRTIFSDGACQLVDDSIRARVVIGADGAGSVVRTALGLPSSRRRGIAIRGYAPTPPEHAGEQVIRFGTGRQPAYAWLFDRGDGLSNLGYGELLTPQRPRPTREHLLENIRRVFPEPASAGSSWLGHLLPLSSWRWRHPDGPVLLTGDAADLVNPATGEGIYYAVATGVAAGRAAVAAIADTSPETSGAAYRKAVGRLLSRHLPSAATGALLMSVPSVASAVVRAAADDVKVFDDLLELGLGDGALTLATVRAAAAALALR